MKVFNSLPFEKTIRNMFSDKNEDLITPSSLEATSNNKELDNLFLGIKFVWVPVVLIGLFALSILILSIF